MGILGVFLLLGGCAGVRTTERAENLIGLLGHDEYRVREKASEEFLNIGGPALTLLKEATRSDDPEIAVRAERLIREIRVGLAPNHKTAQEAVRDGKFRVVRRLLAKGAIDLEARGERGLTLLHVAAACGRTKIAGFLIQKGLDINVKSDGRCTTPLHLAAVRGCAQMVKFLLAKGAGVDEPGSSGMAPLHLAVMGNYGYPPGFIATGFGMGCTDFIGKPFVLIQDATSEWFAGDLFPCDVKTDYGEVISLLIESGADVNARDSLGYTPLHTAVYWHSESSIEILVAAGADLGARDVTRRTPLELAQAAEYKEMAALLRKLDGESGKEPQRKQK